MDEAKVEAHRVMAALAPALAEGTPIVGLEPSCLLALRDEFYSLSLGPAVGQLSKQAFLFEEFLMREGNKGLKLDLKPIPGGRAVVTCHCHQKAFGAMKSVKKVLGWIPGFEFDIVDASCCGMSGSFGLEAEHYETLAGDGRAGAIAGRAQPPTTPQSSPTASRAGIRSRTAPAARRCTWPCCWPRRWAEGPRACSVAEVGDPLQQQAGDLVWLVEGREVPAVLDDAQPRILESRRRSPRRSAAG